MIALRAEFFQTLQKMLELTDQELLQDKFPHSLPHNTGARVLRVGVAVSAFSLLESYVKAIFKELTEVLSTSVMRYRDFPDSLRKFIVIDAVSGLTNSASFIKDVSLKMNHIESEILNISAFDSAPPVYTSHGFSPRGSNVGAEDIKSALSAFGLSDGWGKLNGIASLIGATSVDLRNDYSTIAEARHKSAHTAANIPTNDLKNNINAAAKIGICLDILCMRLAHTIQRSPNARQLAADITAMSYSARFLDLSLDGKWHELSLSGRRTIKKYADKNTALSVMAARRSVDPIIVRNASLTPLELVA